MTEIFPAIVGASSGSDHFSKERLAHDDSPTPARFAGGPTVTAGGGTQPIGPRLLLFRVPFGFNPILGLIALAGILMWNTLILMGQIKTNKDEGLDDFHAVVEATVERSRPVVLRHWLAVAGTAIFY